MITTVLLDVGGPILDEDEDYRASDRLLMALLEREGTAVEEEAFRQARRQAIASYCPSYNSATIWSLVSPDLARFRRIRGALTDGLRLMRRRPTIRVGACEVVSALAARYKVVLAGNQPREVRQALEDAGILRHCVVDVLSDDIGVAKPDTRFFLAALRAAGSTAAESVMVGDRLDNDIFPANVLQMCTIRMLVGPFAQQQPRMPRDLPANAKRSSDIQELPEAVERIASSG